MKINRFGRLYRYVRCAGCFGAVGGAVQGMAATLAGQKMNEAVASELQRQSKQYQTPALDVTRASITASGLPFALAQMEQGRKKATEAYARTRAVPLATSQPRGVSLGGRGGAAWADLVGALRAPLEGYNEFELQQMIKNLRAAQQLGVISQLSAASAKAAPLEVQEAKHKYDWLNTIGASIGGGGNMGLTALGM